MISLSTNKRLLIQFTVGISMIAAIVVVTYKSKKVFENSALWTEHTHDVIAQTQEVLALIKDIQIADQEYIITGDSAFVETANHLVIQTFNAIDKLKDLAADNPSQSRRIDSLANITRFMVKYIQGYGTVKNRRDLGDALQILENGKGKKHIAALQSLLGRIQGTEYMLLAYRKAANRRSIDRFVYIFFAILASEILLLTLIFFLVKFNMRMRSKTERQQSLYKSIINFSDDAIISKDLQDHITSWNLGAEKLFGYSSDEILGKTISLLIPAHRMHEELQITNTIKQDIPLNHYETERIKKDGSLVNISLTVSPLKDSKGNIIGSSKIARDITQSIAQEKSIRQQARLIDLSFDAVLAWDYNDGIIFWSAGAVELYGFTKEEVEGRSSHELLHIRQENGTDFREVLKHAGSWTGELIHRTAQGNVINVESRQRIVQEADGRQIVVETNRDITARKQIEKNLQRTLKEVTDYKFALDESSIVAITDQKGFIKYVNDNFCKISKYPAAELIGRDHRIINSGYHSKEFMQNLWTTIARGKIWKGEIKNKAKDGITYWVDTTIVPFLDELGKPYQYIAIRSDITERKRAEEIKIQNEELREQIRIKNAELVSIFERITDGFIMLDKEYRYIYANTRIGEMTGLQPDFLLGKCVWDIFPDAVGSATYNAFRKAMDSQCYYFHIDYYEPLDLWQENHIYPSKDGLSVFIRDVTKQKRGEEKLIQSEHLYKTIASGIPGTVICLLDKDHRYFLIEGDVLDKLGYSKTELLGRRLEEALPPTRIKETLPGIERAFHGETFSTELRRGEYDFISRFVPMNDENGKVNVVMVVVIEVTELKKAERRIFELNEGLEKKILERTEQLALANKELEAFSYSVAHDLRTPLRAVAGYSNMLLEDYETKFDGEGKRWLSEIQYNNKKMATLIDDLLAFSRLGRKEIKKSSIDMQSLVDSVLADISVGNARIVINKLYSTVADISLMKHVLINLLSNAIKYSAKSDQAIIEISSERKDGAIIYSVKDNGVGFEMEFADKLFGVFQRLHSNEEFEGTGVGLAIVQRIIHRHGGKVWAYGELERGATFYFSLPDLIEKEYQTMSI